MIKFFLPCIEILVAFTIIIPLHTNIKSDSSVHAYIVTKQNIFIITPTSTLQAGHKKIKLHLMTLFSKLNLELAGTNV